MKSTKDLLFTELIGQDVAKRKLGFYHQGYLSTRIVPHLMFVAPKGCGKTSLAKAMGKILTQVDDSSKPKKFYEINCASIKNLNQLCNQFIIPHVQQQECTVLFDECSELPKDVTMALLTILNPNPENRTTFSYEDYTMEFDFRRQSFMFATTEAQSIFHALMDRCERVDLEEYTYDELGDIVALGTPDIKFEDGLLPKIATVLRGTARSGQKMATNIMSYLGAVGGTKFDAEDWKVLMHHLGILPLGLSRIELQVLNILTNKKECSLTNLAAKTGLTPECLRRDFEMYLQKMNLMDITTAGRSITPEGQKYLINLKERRKAAK
jgi:Holliday junction resolvasome RuvABC ATP-dependent DNA helicase subunit